MKSFVIETSGKQAREAVASFLRGLLEQGLVEALLVPQDLPSGDGVSYSLVSSINHGDGMNPFAPVMPVNAAKLISCLTIRRPGKRIGALLRPCEIRALIELVKLRQASLEELIIIGMDCMGTYPMRGYSCIARMRPGKSLGEELLSAFRDGDRRREMEFGMRSACQICDRPFPENAHITLCLFGMDTSREIGIEAKEEIADGLATKFDLKEGEREVRRKEAISRLIEERKKRQEELATQFKERVKTVSGLLQEISTCMNCHNCRVACPICYCRECLFDSPTLAHEPREYLRWAERKGALRFPADTLLYHIGRMNHMLTSCVGCGQCEAACPNMVPLLKMFPIIAREVQKQFEYTAGRALDEPLPLTTFREEELTHVERH